MTDNTQQGGPGKGRGLPAPRSGSEPADEDLREQLVEDESLRRLTRPTPAKAGPPITVDGVVRRAEVESQPWVLDAEDGTTYELMLARDAQAPEPGSRVKITGVLADDMATTAQVGPILRVISLATEQTDNT